jgi:N-acetylglutamate synthase-like GNAT family acetyltransferase
MEYRIELKEGFGPEEFKLLDDGINEHTRELFGEVSRGSLAFFARGEDEKVIGGVAGYWSEFGWLYVDALWVSPVHRGAGLGIRLMQQIEEKAVELGCKHAYLNTMSFQAPEFYKRLGYIQVAELEDFPPGHSRLFFRKELFVDR